MSASRELGLVPPSRVLGLVSASRAPGLVSASRAPGLVSASRALVKAIGDILPQGQGYPHPSPHVPLKPAKRSATPEHMLAEQVTAVSGSSLQQLAAGSSLAAACSPVCRARWR